MEDNFVNYGGRKMKMNERIYQKLNAQMSEISNKTLAIATYTIDNKVDQELTEVERTKSILLVCCGMIMGEKNTKRKHFIKGVVLGTVITGVVCAVRNVKNEKETKEEES